MKLSWPEQVIVNEDTKYCKIKVGGGTYKSGLCEIEDINNRELIIKKAFDGYADGFSSSSGFVIKLEKVINPENNERLDPFAFTSYADANLVY